MQHILIRAGCFIVIILAGFLLRKAGVFRAQDFKVLSNIVLKLTLPAAIISGFSAKELDPALLSLIPLGFCTGLIYVVLAVAAHLRQGKEHQAFSMINLSGYNIGCFSMPFVQSFLGPAGVIAVSLFDVGNACICLGPSYTAARVRKAGGGVSPRRVLLPLITSVPLLCYIVMTVLKLLHLSLPAPVLSLAEIVGDANPFLSMLMIGVGFRLEANRTQAGRILKLLCLRYGVAVLFALLFWFLPPLPLYVRQVLVLLVFSPVGSSAPAYTAELGGDVGLSSAVTSLTIIISIIIMVTLMVIMF